MEIVYIYSHFPILDDFKKWREKIDKLFFSLSIQYVIFIHSNENLEEYLNTRYIYIPLQIEPFLSYSLINHLFNFVSSNNYQYENCGSFYISSNFKNKDDNKSYISNFLQSSKKIIYLGEESFGFRSTPSFLSYLQIYQNEFKECKKKDIFKIPSFINWSLEREFKIKMEGYPSLIFPSRLLICYTFGGLGNMLYQVTTGLALSLEYNIPLRILYDPKYIENYRAPTFRYSNNHYHIFDKICRIQRDDIPSDTINYQEPNTNYQDNLFYFMDHFKQYSNKTLSLTGYFQCTQYFKKYWKTIQKYFLNHSYEKICEQFIYDYRLSKLLFTKKIISIHIRGGDYLKHSDHYVILSSQYYQNIIENHIYKKYSRDECIFCIFTDDKNYVNTHFSSFLTKDSTFYIDELLLEWLKINPHYKKNIESNQDEFELFLMSYFDILICANSSFSLFASYLSDSNDIYIPSQWTKDKNQKEWVKNYILNESYQLIDVDI